MWVGDYKSPLLGNKTLSQQLFQRGIGLGAERRRFYVVQLRLFFRGGWLVA